MPLITTLARGAVTGLRKRPHPGAELPATRLTSPAAAIDPRRAAAYARVCGFSAADPLPLTYPHILGFPLAARLMADPAFPLPLLGLVHTSIDIVQHAPLHAGDQPELTVHAEESRPHRRGTEVVITTEARVGGELRWSDRSTYLARHATPRQPEPPAPGQRTDQRPEASAPLPTTATWRLPASLGRRHARVSGDYNPIHLYPLTARLFGFPRAIAHGMWTIARCAAQQAADRGGMPETVRVRAEFKAPVLLPATVAYGTDNGRFELRGGPGGERLHLTGELLTGPAVSAATAPRPPSGDRP